MINIHTTTDSFTAFNSSLFTNAFTSFASMNLQDRVEILAVSNLEHFNVEDAAHIVEKAERDIKEYIEFGFTRILVQAFKDNTYSIIARD